MSARKQRVKKKEKKVMLSMRHERRECSFLGEATNGEGIASVEVMIPGTTVASFRLQSHVHS